MSSTTHDDHHGEYAGPPRKREEDIFGKKASNSKVGMWLYLMTDALTFGGFLLGYALLRARAEEWPTPADVLGLKLSGAMTFLLICSSVTMVLSQAKGEDRDRKGMLKFLGMTIVGGVIFLSLQAYEYVHLIQDWGMTLANFTQGPPLFASTFFVITGFHGLHVLAGVIYLSIIFFRAWRGKYDDGNCDELETAGLFWHFVDLVWILVFTFMYLI